TTTAFPASTRHLSPFALAAACRPQPIVTGCSIVTTGVFVGVTAGAVPVAARLIAIGVAVLRGGALLDDFRSDVAQHFASDLLIFLEILASASSPISHG